MNYTDKAITSSTQDFLDFDDYCRVLTGTVQQAQTPLTVGIFGPWGSGKTSLMQLVKEALEAQQPGPLTVWFNAWKYDQEDALWRALVIQVLNTLRPPPEAAGEDLEAPPETYQQALEKRQKARQELERKLDDLENSLYSPVEREELGGVKVDWEQLLRGSVLGATRLSLSLVPGIGAVLGKGVEEAQKAITGKDLNTIFDAVQRERRKIYRRHVQSLEQFQQEFSKLVKEQVVDQQRQLVIFIDDLDRCLPEKAIEVLEAIKLFLDVEGCLFFLGVDRGVIEQGIRVKYKGFLDAVNAESARQEDKLKKDRRIPITGDDYLEKIVQLPFHLLPLDEQRVADFINKSGADLPPRCAGIFAAGLEANPRKVKRALNIFRLLHQLAQQRQMEFSGDGQPIPIDPQLLAKVVVIQSRYRNDLYADLLEFPKLLPELESLFRGDGASSSEADPLFAATEAKEPIITPADSATETGPTLLDKYRANRQLRRLLQAGDSFFANRSEDEVKLYLYLTTTTAETRAEALATDATRRWQELLLSNDPIKIRSVAAEIQTDTPEAWRDIVARLESMTGNPAETKRAAANTALAYSHDQMATLPLGQYPVGPRGSTQTVEAVKLNRYPVTNAMYKLFLEANPGHQAPDGWQDRWYPAGQGRLPVSGVSWSDTQDFCRWAGKRLPKAEEWQAALDLLEQPDDFKEWTNTAAGSGYLVMPGKLPEAVTTKRADLGFRVAE